MMMALLLAKGKIKKYYEKNYTVLKPIIKFIVSFLIFISINSQVGYDEKLANPLVSLGLSLVCAMAPEQVIVYLASLLCIVQVGYLSPMLAISLLLLLLTAYLLFGRYAKEQCFIVLAIPLLTAFHISYVVPIVVGLLYGPVVIPALIVGVVFRYIFMGIRELFLAPAGTIDLEDTLGAFHYVVNYVFENKELALFILAFVLTYLATYGIRKMKVSYASQIGILVGIIVMLVSLLLGNILFDAEIDIVLVLTGICISMVVSYVIQFFRMTLDYTGTKSIQFEDEEYYYYVKAVPKMNVAEKDKNMTYITPKQDTGDISSLQEEFEKVFEEERSEKNSI